MYRSNQEDDPFLQQARIDVISALAAIRLFHDHRDQVVHILFKVLGH